MPTRQHPGLIDTFGHQIDQLRATLAEERCAVAQQAKVVERLMRQVAALTTSLGEKNRRIDELESKLGEEACATMDNRKALRRSA